MSVEKLHFGFHTRLFSLPHHENKSVSPTLGTTWKPAQRSDESLGKQVLLRRTAKSDATEYEQKTLRDLLFPMRREL